MRRRSGLTAQFVPRKKGLRKNIFLLSTDANEGNVAFVRTLKRSRPTNDPRAAAAARGQVWN
jgi:hypothetical protein